ncbi:MAG: hypothetical protein QXM12_07405 [Nitrososphaerota archaeon]
MSVRLEDVQKKLMEMAVDGIGLYIVDKVVEFLKPYTQRTLKQYTEPAVKLGLSLIDVVIPQIREAPYVGDWLELWGKSGVRDAIRTLVDKPATCWAEDQNTITCVNFDTTDVVVKINGQPVTFTVDGTKDEFRIHLSTPLSAGAYDLVVVGNARAFSGKIYV